MRISVDVTGHLDWEQCPPGTEITEADVAAGRVKLLSDGKYHMRVTRVRDTHHDFGIHEASVCARMAALMRLGKPQSREQVVAELAQNSLAHHVPRKHMKALHVDDDGPDVDAFAAALAEHDKITDEQAAAALAEYADSSDMQAYLTAVLVKAPKEQK